MSVIFIFYDIDYDKIGGLLSSNLHIPSIRTDDIMVLSTNFPIFFNSLGMCLVLWVTSSVHGKNANGEL